MRPWAFKRLISCIDAQQASTCSTPKNNMLLKLTHTTDLTYSDLISESVMELRMAPRQEMDQHRLSFHLAIGPQSQVSSYFDWLGNTVHAFTINGFHNSIRIVATSVVETDRHKVEVDRFKDTWPIEPNGQYALYDFLQFGGPIVDCAKLRDLVKVLNVQPGMSLGEVSLRMMHLIGEKFVYKKGVTNVASPLTDMLDKQSGVCQDFTHLMIALARALKIPARYVSGLVHPDTTRFRGYTQTHAWVELLFPSTGWIGFDPTNQSIVGGNFVKVAIGRDYRDVSPNRGVYRGQAKETIEVTVHSDELVSVPQGLAAERVTPLSIALPPSVSTPLLRTRANQQQEHQQQQQQQSAPMQQQQQQQ
jgi:transglutaminase-like putative cysteine protease